MSTEGDKFLPNPFYASYVMSKKGWSDLPIDLPCRECFGFNGLKSIQGKDDNLIINVECESPNELIETSIQPSDINPDLRKRMGKSNYKIKLGYRCFMKKI